MNVEIKTVEQYKEAIANIRSEIKALREHPDLPNGEYRGVWACTDIINKYLGEEAE